MSSAPSATASREAVLGYEAEVRDLMATIAALRDALEQEQSVSARRVSRALLITDSEIAQLKNTAIALRETLEQTGRPREQAVQAAVLAASQEITSLKAAIFKLRDQIELMRQEKEAAVQAVVLRTHDEITQLKESKRLCARGSTIVAQARQRNMKKLVQDSASSATLTKLEQRLHLFDFLLKLSNQMSAFGNLDDVLNAFVEIATRELNAERGTIFLNDPTTNELYSRVAQGHLRHEIRILNSSGIAGSVFTAQESLISLEPSAEWCAYA